MEHSKNKHRFFKTLTFSHLMFWLVVFIYFVLYMNITYYGDYRQLFEFSFAIVSLQIITAYTGIYYLIPQFLKRKRTLLFVLLLLVLLVIMYAAYLVFKSYYYDVRYFEYFTPEQKEQAQQSFWDRFINMYSFLKKSLKFLTPAALLLVARIYKTEQTYLKLNEQKKIAELTALKHQLNPHFLFNTLNNLYALAIKKSDETPEVIEKLSDILDYMLYRCDDTFVLLSKEIELIKNYLSLEKLRYGKRVNVNFSERIEQEVKIAPFLLLTFIENAFKHGVAQELKEAFIIIKISADKNEIVFDIKNSNSFLKVSNNKGIGLDNVKKQLELLYGNSYSLYIKNEGGNHHATLKLKSK